MHDQHARLLDEYRHLREQLPMDASRLVRASWESYVDQWRAPAIQGVGSEYEDRA